MGVEEGVEMAESKVGSGAMATEGVEVPTTDEDKLRYAEGGGASRQCANVVPFSYVMHHNVALDPEFEFRGH